jgi:hypothetical protein
VRSAEGSGIQEEQCLFQGQIICRPKWFKNSLTGSEDDQVDTKNNVRAALSVSSILQLGVASHNATLPSHQSRRTTVSSKPFVVFERFQRAPTTLYCSVARA